MTNPPLVLVVDDNAQNLKLARDVLRAAGMRTIEASTGAEGIACAEEHRPDVILMDLGLPDMTGAAAALTLTRGPLAGGTSIVAMSASSIDDDDWLRASGFAGFIGKPIDVGVFADEVRRYAGHPRPG